MGYITRLSALVAQRIEQLPSKQWVVGSIPARGAILFVYYQQLTNKIAFLSKSFKNSINAK